ncbi:MAG: hypothetical protein UV19_C0014G0002 [Parcubacteria group bacterium GW2011_GWA2_42_28]|nr:MAG: hypothetical protein UV19_C0014G0002 [Parcubacteria group bacterium GW2011_GWA2_42_28]
MPQQARRDVLLMDVHGVFLSAEDPNRSESVLHGARRHQKWVDAVRQALKEAGALSHQIQEALFDPQVFWTMRMRVELATPKNAGGRAIRERKFHERVNLRLLREVAPAFICGLDKRVRRRIARRVKELRQEASRESYFLDEEMRELVQWVMDGDRRWMLCLTTAGDHDLTVQQLRTQDAPARVHIFSTVEVGLLKSHPDFWTKIAARVEYPSDRCVVVEDNLIMGMNAVKAGMSVIFLDRDYGIENFIRKELRGEVAGVSLSHVGESLPMDGAQFVVCAKTPAGIRLCLERIKSAPRGDT